MPTKTTMVCTNHPLPSGNQVVMQANQAAMPSAFGTCTAIVAAPVPGGQYHTIAGSANDTATVDVTQADFNTLCQELQVGSVELVVSHNGSTIVGFQHFPVQSFLKTAAAVARIETKVDALEPAELRADVEVIRTKVEAIASDIGDVRAALADLLRRVPRADSELPPRGDGQAYRPPQNQ